MNTDSFAIINLLMVLKLPVQYPPTNSVIEFRVPALFQAGARLTSANDNEGSDG